jgi:hypothetical protein
MGKEPEFMSLEELARDMRFRADSDHHLTAKAEWSLRQMRMQIDATIAQKETAEAEAKAAEASIASA